MAKITKEKYKELLEEYAWEFMDEAGTSEREPFEMEMLPEFLQVKDSDSYFNLMFRMFYGYRWYKGVENADPSRREEFNPNDAYCAFNAYGNLISIPDYYYDEYIEDNIDENDFIAYCKEQGYIDEEEEVESSVRKPRFTKRLQASLKKRILSRKPARKFERKPLK